MYTELVKSQSQIWTLTFTIIFLKSGALI
ncbi:hypothetical protein BpHYR1_011352 [Brachionus plicatilis]|uniref:Uncharacterized protein n=1 Tax=Brachionus plicatilis TaxID=10195 RepID=A0A3M7SLP9_BRAPC|nr:hypothetical protein BpHYR1_011352 [Brachionus plicatilis]